jgi:hypothetical protein
MNDKRQDPTDRRHYEEPEILPPERKQRGRDERTRVYTEEFGIRRIYVTKVGPLGFLTFSLVAGIVSIALLILFMGAFVILLPVLGVLFVAGLIVAVLRGFSNRRE